MFNKMFLKSVLTLLVIGGVSMSFLTQEEIKRDMLCTADIVINNRSSEDITKVIADDSPTGYGAYDNILSGTQETITGFSWGTGFTLIVRFSYQPTVGNRIRIYDNTGLIDCLDIQSGVTDYFFYPTPGCGNITVLYEAGSC